MGKGGTRPACRSIWMGVIILFLQMTLSGKVLEEKKLKGKDYVAAATPSDRHSFYSRLDRFMGILTPKGWRFVFLELYCTQNWLVLTPALPTSALSFPFLLLTWKACFSLFNLAHLSLSFSSLTAASSLLTTESVMLATSLAASSRVLPVTGLLSSLSCRLCMTLASTARSRASQPARPSSDVRLEAAPFWERALIHGQ